MTRVTIQVMEEQLTVYLSGEIDHHSQKSLRDQVDHMIRLELPKTLVLDFSGVTFMDSAGIGFVLARYRLMSQLGGVVIVQGVNEVTARMMRLSGVEKLVTLKPMRAEKTREFFNRKDDLNETTGG